METYARLSRLDGPTPGLVEEPLTVTEVAEHLRIDADAEYSYLESLIGDAREEFERETGRQLMTQTWVASLGSFPEDDEPIVLPLPPLLSIEEISYLDSDGVSQIWDPGEYVVSVYLGSRATRGRIVPAVGYSYPSTQSGGDAVQISFTAGYGTSPNDIPRDIKRALLLLVTHHFLHRQSPEKRPVSLDGLLAHYRGTVFA